jgi:glycosyltransferase involved in cell wall biosynthesis
MSDKDKIDNNQKLNRDRPRVSIGMPVFNGEKYVEEALDSILKQTFSNFELIISDNASTDRTQTICLSYASKDPRVQYYRNETNIGAPENFNRVFNLSSGDYFRWATYDDLIAPEFLEKCVSVLDKDPSIVGCICKTGRIDQNGNLVGYYNEKFLKKMASSKPHERFRDLLNMYYTTTPLYAVYRTRFFAQSQLHGSYIGADRNLVAELSLLGRIYEIPQCLFFWRDHPDSYTTRFYGRDLENTLDRLRREITWWSKEGGTYCPHWKNCIEYFRSVNRIPLKLSERLLCYFQIFGWFLKQGRHFMLKDIILFQLQHSRIASKLFQMIPMSVRVRAKSKLIYFIN